MSLKKQALSGVFWSSIQLFGTQGISFVVSIVLARLLLPEEFGLIAMLGVFIGLGTALINSGLTQSLIRAENPDQEDFSTVFFFNLLGSVLIYIFIFFLAPFIAEFYNENFLTAIIRIYSVTFIINAFSAIQITRLNKIMDFKTQMRVSIPSLFISSIIGITMAFNGYGVWSLVWSAITQALASTIQLWYWAKWKPSWVFSVPKFKLHFNYGVKLMLSSVLDILFTNVYAIIIGKFFAPAQVGFYNRAETLKMYPVSTISSVITKVTFSLFSTIQNDDVRLKIVYKKIMQMVLFITTPTLILMAILAEPMFRFLFTEKWLPAVPYFQILCFSGIMYPLHSYNLQILMVKGRSDLFLKLEIIKKILTVVIILFSFQYGIYGLLYGSVLGSVLAFFINTHYSGKFLDYTAWQQFKDIFPIIIITSVMGSIIFTTDQVLKNYDFGDFFRLFLGASVGLLTYIITASIFKISSLSELITIIKRK